MKTRLSICLFLGTISAVQGLPVWINEFHYDNTGTDAGEFIEVAGVAGTDLSTYFLVLYNGSGGAVYDTDALLGLIPNQQNGYGTVSFPYPVNGIQNGVPDGIALVQGSTLLQFLSYGGTFAGVGGAANGVTSTDVGVDEAPAPAAGQSLQLIGNGTDYGDFTWSGPSAASPGAVNAGQTFPRATVPESAPGVAALTGALGLMAIFRRRWVR